MLVYIYLLNRCLALKEDSKSGDTSRGDKLLSGDDVYPGALTERGRSLFSGRTKKWLVSQNVPRSVFLSFFWQGWRSSLARSEIWLEINVSMGTGKGRYSREI